MSMTSEHLHKIRLISRPSKQALLKRKKAEPKNEIVTLKMAKY